jgi:hypothetical protein
MGSSDYRGAFAFVHPLDLAQLRTQVLPVFLQAGSSEDGEVQQVVGMFFDGIPEERRSRLSGPEVFVQLQKMLKNAEPTVIELFAQAKLEILEIKRNAPTEATVRYQVTIKGESAEESQGVGRFNGRWYLHMAESPAEAAAKFRRVLAQ